VKTSCYERKEVPYKKLFYRVATRIVAKHQLEDEIMKRLTLILISLLLLFSLVLTSCQQAAPAVEEVEEPAAEEPMEEEAEEPAAEEPMEEEAEEPAVEEPVEEEAAAPEDAEPILIGSSLPLTGSFSIPGEKHRDGYQLCVDLINEAGGLLGRPVELLVSDNQSDVETALAQFERFINQDEVDLIFGTFSSLISFPASSVTEQAGMVHPLPSAGALRIYERGYENLFYFQPNAAEYIGESPTALLQDLVGEEDMPETAALVWADDFFANAIAAGLLGEEVEVEGRDEPVDLSPGGIAEAGMEVVYTEQWPEQGFSDWVTLANAIKAADPDMLFALVTSPDEGIELVRALQTVDFQPEAMFMSQGAQREFEEQLGEAANGIMIHASWHPLANFTGELNGEPYTNEDFLRDFEERFGRPGDEDEAIPFALCQGMEQAVRATGTTDNAEIRAWLASRSAEEPVKTILGDFYWDERGLAVDKPFIMVQWQDQNLEFVYPQGAFPGVKDLQYPKPEW
jgi:branched-chain amino acid transport system substrate-binding protein